MLNQSIVTTIVNINLIISSLYHSISVDINLISNDTEAQHWGIFINPFNIDSNNAFLSQLWEIFTNVHLNNAHNNAFWVQKWRFFINFNVNNGPNNAFGFNYGGHATHGQPWEHTIRMKVKFPIL